MRKPRFSKPIMPRRVFPEAKPRFRTQAGVKEGESYLARPKKLLMSAQHGMNGLFL